MADFFSNDSFLGNVGNFLMNAAGVPEKVDAVNQIHSGDVLGGAANLTTSLNPELSGGFLDSRG